MHKMFTKTFITAKIRQIKQNQFLKIENFKCSTLCKWIKQLSLVHTMEYYTVAKMNETRIMYINMENILG